MFKCFCSLKDIYVEVQPFVTDQRPTKTIRAAKLMFLSSSVWDSAIRGDVDAPPLPIWLGSASFGECQCESGYCSEFHCRHPTQAGHCSCDIETHNGCTPLGQHCSACFMEMPFKKVQYARQFSLQRKLSKGNLSMRTAGVAP